MQTVEREERERNKITPADRLVSRHLGEGGVEEQGEDEIKGATAGLKGEKQMRGVGGGR